MSDTNRLISQEEIDKEADRFAKTEQFESNGSIKDSLEEGFHAGISFAESKMKEIMKGFGKWIIEREKLNAKSSLYYLDSALTIDELLTKYLNRDKT